MPPKAKEEAEETAPSTVWVRYLNPLVDRSISAADWRAAGVIAEGRKTVRWDNSNGRVVNADELDFLTDEEFHRFIASDPDFKVEDTAL